MIVISNHLTDKMPIPEDAIIRINLAWFDDYQSAKSAVEVGGDIYLDFPSGRTKPPKPTIEFRDAVVLAMKNENVKYFAISNAENIDLLTALQLLMPDKTIVPKIETATGVNLLSEMKRVGITTVMLDKEDLYVNVGTDSVLYEKLIENVRNSGLNVLELQGVVFG